MVNNRADFLRDMARVWIDRIDCVVDRTRIGERVDELTIRERLGGDEYRQNRKAESGDRRIAHGFAVVGDDTAANGKRARLTPSLRRLELPNLTRMRVGIADAGMSRNLLDRLRQSALICIAGAATEDPGARRQLARDQR